MLEPAPVVDDVPGPPPHVALAGSVRVRVNRNRVTTVRFPAPRFTGWVGPCAAFRFPTRGEAHAWAEAQARAFGSRVTVDTDGDGLARALVEPR